MSDDHQSQRDGTRPEARSEEDDGAPAAREEGFFEVLGTQGGRAVLAALTRERTPLSAIAEETNISRATVYRNVEKLRALDLVEERTTIPETGGRETLVRLSVTDATVSFGGKAVEARFIPADAAGRFSWLLDALADSTEEA